MTALTADNFISDANLLRSYSAHRDQEAFRTLVYRHIDWIYATALRITRDPAMAEDVTQGVLVLLSQKAAQLCYKTSLGGWLLRATHFRAIASLRAQRRRKEHEKMQAPKEGGVSPDQQVEWNDIKESLDNAVLSLTHADRDAIVLRYYQRLSHGQMAAALGINQEAARKRVTRALERLRVKLNVGGSSCALDLALLAAPTHLAPAHLATGILTGAVSANTSLLLKGALYLMPVSKANIAVLAAAVILAIGSTSGILWKMNRPGSGSAHAPIAHSPPLLEDLYGLAAGEIVKCVNPTPDDEVRLAFLQRQYPNDRDIQLPVMMFLAWRDGSLVCNSSIPFSPATQWARPQAGPDQGTDASAVIRDIMRAPFVTFEGDDDLLHFPIAGDIIYKESASAEEYRAGLEQMLSKQIGSPVTLTYKLVGRPVTVLRGQWHYHPVFEGDAANAANPVIQLYGENADSSGGARESGTSRNMAEVISALTHQELIVEATDVPDNITYHITDGPKFSDHDLVLTHVQEQTGLVRTQEIRQVRRLFIEHAK